MVCGSSAMVFFSGMPSEAAGPVADSVTPTLMSAQAAVQPSVMAAASSAFLFASMWVVSSGKVETRTPVGPETDKQTDRSANDSTVV